jgi:hypothetical protein
LEELERTNIPGLVEVLREEGIDAVRYVLWDATLGGTGATLARFESGSRHSCFVLICSYNVVTQ